MLRHLSVFSDLLDSSGANWSGFLMLELFSLFNSKQGVVSRGLNILLLKETQIGIDFANLAVS